jgi:hypothetical protein
MLEAQRLATRPSHTEVAQRPKQSQSHLVARIRLATSTEKRSRWGLPTSWRRSVTFLGRPLQHSLEVGAGVEGQGTPAVTDVSSSRWPRAATVANVSLMAEPSARPRPTEDALS